MQKDHRRLYTAFAQRTAELVAIFSWQGEIGKHDVGKWVAAPGPDGKPLAMCVVSVPRRSIPLQPGVLGGVARRAGLVGALGHAADKGGGDAARRAS